jgi:16S rRNA processing protein RimM
VGRIDKAHGIKGEVIVSLTTDRVERVAVGSVLYTPDLRRLEVLASNPHHHRWIVRFDGLFDRGDAERLHGKALLAEPLEDDEAMWVHELIGSSVVDAASGSVLGVVESVEDNPAADLLVLDGGGLIPTTFVVSHERGRVTVEIPEGLLE